MESSNPEHGNLAAAARALPRVILARNSMMRIREAIDLFLSLRRRLESEIARLIPWTDTLTFSLSEERLLRLMSRETTLEDILYTSYAYSGYWIYRSIRPEQIPSEIKELLKEVKENGSSIVLEIGTAAGGTLYLFSRFLESQKIITIDLDARAHAEQSQKAKLFKLFGPGKRIYPLRGDSHDPETIEEVTRILGTDEVDFLFIDGDHSYEGVRKDLEVYGDFVRRGGIIAFHDIANPNLGVKKFWNEIKHRYVSKEIIAPTCEMSLYARSSVEKRGWGGIGILRL